LAEREGAKGIDLVAAGWIGGLPAAFLDGRERDLLVPLRFATPGEPLGFAPPPAERAALARGLAVANAAYGHPGAAALAEKLADPATRVVVTGQQTGLFGGPLLALVKAAAAVRWAEALEAAGEPAVAVFWMATEDHDFAEVAKTTFLAPDGARSFDLGEDPAPLLPVGMRSVGGRVEGVLAELRATFTSAWFAGWLDRLAAWWRPDARFGEAFARQLVATLGGRSPLVLDALLPELKSAERPFLATLVERRGELDRAIAAREAEIVGRGHALQVAPQPGVSPLFLLRGGERRRIEWRGDDRFALRGADGEQPVAELLETIAENPAVVSPGVLARPAIQDAALGTSVLILGPGETAYLPQAAPAYALLGIAPPALALRPQAVVLDGRQAEHLADLDLGLADLLGDPAAARRKLGERAGGGFVEPVRARVAEILAELQAPATALDPNLEKPYEKTRESVDRALEAFAGKVAAAAARRDELHSQRLDQLVETLQPGGVFQERSLSAGYFPGKYGEGFGAALLDQLDLDPRRLSVVDPTRPGASGSGE